MPSPHEILGVAADADLLTIKRAYFTRAKTAHPDAGGSKEEFVRLYAAYEAMTARREEAPAVAEQPRAEDARQQAPQQKSFEEIKQEVWEELARDAAWRASQKIPGDGPSVLDVWVAAALTPLCAGAVSVFLCYDGKDLEPSLWTFSFALALAALVYAGGLAAVLGSGLPTYWRTVVLVSLGAILMSLPSHLLRGPDVKGRPVISRRHVPTWWILRE
jgi:hypothetical protein